MRTRFRVVDGLLLAALGLSAFPLARAQAVGGGAADGQGAGLETHGQVMVAGKEMPYRIRRLPVSSFPELPMAVAAALTTRGCLIPQTYEAKRPENVIHASLERAGSQDWAVLCSAQGEVSLLVFLASRVGSGAAPAVVVKKAEMKCLEVRNALGEMGFDWGIDPAGPKRVHDAQAGMPHRLPLLDHDCVAASEGDGKTIYHLYRDGAWETIATE